MAISKVTIRRARRDDVGVIVAMLADDPLGGARERLEDPLPQPYFKAFETVDRDPNIQLVVAEDGAGAVVGCLQLCILPGLNGPSRKRGAGVANWWNCSRTIRASMRNGSTSGSDSREAMSA